jgi:hypothetical protein
MANMGGVRKPAADDQVRKAVPHSVVRTPATPSVPTKIAAVPKAAAPKLVYHKAPSAPRHRRMVIANADTEGSTHVYNGTPGPRREETTSISEPPMVIALNPEFADPFSVRKSSNPVGPAFSGPGTAEDGKPSPSLASGGTNMDATGASATDGALDACEDVGARYKADSGAETDVTITNVDLLNDADADTRVAALFSYP